MGIAAGILIIIISIAHNVYGEKKQVPELKQITSDPVMIGSLRIMIFQGGILLFAVGCVQLLVAMDIMTLTGWAVYFPIGIILINVLTSLLIAAFIHPEIFKVTIPQFILFAIIIGLQWLALPH